MKFFLIFFISITAPKMYADTLNERLKFLLSKYRLSEKDLGIYVEEEGKEILGINSSRQMIPASLTKIVTGAAVLNAFPINKKFETKILAKNPIKQGILSGDLCIKGGGDPSFVSEKMWYLVNELKRNELKIIQGNLLVDATRFDDELFDSGRDSKRVDRAFDAPVSAASFNWNSVNIYIRPAERAGLPAKIFLDPQSEYLELENKTKTVLNSGVRKIEASRLKLGNRDKIIVNGSLSLESNEIVIYKSISNPNLWVGMHLKEFLKDRGISLKGEVKVSVCENDANTLAVAPSKNLNEMVADMLKFSNNYVAEMLVKNLAAEQKSEPAKMSDGIEQIKKYLDRVGLKRKDYILENVSGLTRDNRFSAKSIVSVLNTLKNDFTLFPEFASGLPIAGVDGTLKNRMKNQENAPLVRAKTGYLDGIAGLAGYIARKSGPPLIFAFMYNGDYEKALQARLFFDELISELK